MSKKKASSTKRIRPLRPAFLSCEETSFCCGQGELGAVSSVFKDVEITKRNILWLRQNDFTSYHFTTYREPAHNKAKVLREAGVTNLVTFDWVSKSTGSALTTVIFSV